MHAQFQVEKRLVLVENWQMDKFEVFLDLAAFAKLEDHLTVKLNANFTNRLPVHANATIRLLALSASNSNQTGRSFCFDSVSSHGFRSGPMLVRSLLKRLILI